MEPRNDLESLDIEVSNLNEDPFHDDYMTDEEASFKTRVGICLDQNEILVL